MTDALIEQISSTLTELLERIVAEQRFPGLAVGIVRDQDLVWFRGFGHADFQTGRPASQQSLHRVASITKTFTTTAILQLRDEGLLSLDDPLTRHIPEFSAARTRAGTVQDVTIRRLLTHRSGLTTESPLPSWDALKFPTREELLAALPNTEVVIPQDSAFKYSNLAFALLGEVVARVSGRPYFEYMRTEILDPLDMSSTVFELTDELRPQFAVGHSPSPFEDEFRRAPYAPLNGMSACGQLHSSVQDLAKWISLQFRTGDVKRGGSQVLHGHTIEESHRPQYLEPDWSGGYCLGWRANRIGEHVYLGHGGGIHGFASQILFSKPHRIGAICLANVWPHSGALNTAVEVLETVVAAETAASQQALDSVGALNTPAHLKMLLGVYNAAPGIPVDIVYRNGSLRLEKSATSDYLLHVPAQLEATDDPREFIVRGGRGSGERAVFEVDDRDKVTSFHLGGFVYRKLATLGAES